MSELIIFTGPIGSGKTTSLQNFLKDKNCDGIISPIIDGKRYLQRVKTGETKPLEIESDDGIKIGKYVFDRSVFSWAKEIISDLLKIEPEYLVIDEIGPLELDGQGFEPMIFETINEFDEYRKFSLILVVRESLLEKVIEHYKLPKGIIELKKPDHI